MTSYEKIYSRFLSKIEDSDLPKLTQSESNQLLEGWLESALGLMEIDKLKIEHDLSARHSEDAYFEEDLTNAEIEVLALYMVVAWYEPRVNSLEHTLLFMGSKDEKWTNQKDHLNAIKSIQESYRVKARKYVRNHSSRVNAYLYPDEG